MKITKDAKQVVQVLIGSLSNQPLSDDFSGEITFCLQCFKGGITKAKCRTEIDIRLPNFNKNKKNI